MINLTQELKRGKVMIKSISFDLDDTLWPLMPNIMKAEEVTNEWIKENYPGTAKLLGTKDVIEIRDELIKNNPNLVNQISELRRLMFYELNIRAGYKKEESEEMAKEAFDIYFKGRNTVTFYDGVIDTLKLLKEKYSLGVVTNGNADLKIIGIDYLFDYCFSAADLNAHKPDPIMFEAVIDKTGLKANEICHIGDHPINDVKASLDFGMIPIWFNYEKQNFPLEEIQVAEFSDWSSLPNLIKSL
tara:strand:- start:1679 stop:2410 length:732 start_codon:yes stop_codon:yes gene_type:complete